MKGKPTVKVSNKSQKEIIRILGRPYVTEPMEFLFKDETKNFFGLSMRWDCNEILSRRSATYEEFEERRHKEFPPCAASTPNPGPDDDDKEWDLYLCTTHECLSGKT